jgi:putative peptidoglycan lipid II flippase
MLPLLIGASFGHINVVVDQIMASSLPTGSIASLNYANRLHSVLTQLFIMVVSRAVLPFFAHRIAEDDVDGAKRLFFQTLKGTLLILIPISVGVFVFGKWFIHVVFERGAFTAQSTTATSQAWMAYAVGLPMQAAGILTARMYNALQHNITLMVVAGAGVGLNIIFNRIFMEFWGHVGIAASTSALYCITTCVLVYYLHRKIDLFGKK